MLYWYGLGSEVLVETDLSGNNPTEYVFFDGKRTARRDSSGAVYYYFADHLGSSRVLANASGTVVEESDFLPFGGERAILDSLNNQYKFTGKERDTETQNDYFGARFYASNLGRFLSPDKAVPELGNPQSLNKYAYVFNNPLRYVDPDGRWPEWFHHEIIEDLFGHLGRHAVAVIEGASDWVDSFPNQLPGKAYMHAMRETWQSVAEAEAATNDWIESELGAAAEAQVAHEAAGGIGYSDMALEHFGHALHTVTDRECPAHAGYQRAAYKPLSIVIHIYNDERAARSFEASAAEARHNAYVAASRLWGRFLQMVAQRNQPAEKEEKKKAGRKKKGNEEGKRHAVVSYD